MNPFRFASLKARLTALTLSLVGTVWLAAAVFTWFEARHEAEEIFDAHLVQAASLLVAQAARETDDGDAADDEEDEEEKHVGERVAKHGLNDISQQIFVIL